MKILVTGAAGQLGYDVCRVLAERGIEHKGTDIADFDITDGKAAGEYISAYAPSAVIHCSAYTAVDRAEEEPEQCRRVNAQGTRNIAQACRRLDAKLLYLSTDYVFSGEGDAPYAEDAPTGPLNVYGRSKLEGEQAVRELVRRHYIVRTSWVYGKNGHNFVKTMLRLGLERGKVSVVNDQIGSPTYTPDLARLLCDMALKECYGTYHATNEGVCSWAEFAAEIFRQAGLQVQLQPVTTEEYPAKAARPRNSRLSKEKLAAAGFSRLPRWENALERYLRELREQQDGGQEG